MATSTIERRSTIAKVRFVRMSASKVRVVLDQIRNKRAAEALQLLGLSERLAAKTIAKCLNSAIANAEHNDNIPMEELVVSACFADKGATLKRFRPVGRGRAGAIHKQTCHITVEVSRMTDEELDSLRERLANKATKSKANSTQSRSRRVAKSKKADAVSDEEVTEAAEATESIEVEEAVTDTTKVAEATEVEEVVAEDTEENTKEESVSEEDTKEETE